MKLMYSHFSLAECIAQEPLEASQEVRCSFLSNNIILTSDHMKIGEGASFFILHCCSPRIEPDNVSDRRPVPLITDETLHAG